MVLSIRTLLFSDVEGSTSLLDRAGSQYRALLNEHRRMVRAALEQVGGIEHGTEGDSFFLSFDSPTAALAAAVEAQRAIEKHDWPDGLRLVLRIYDRNNQKTAIQFVDYVLSKLPFQAECIQTDNGDEFQGAFHWHLLDRGIQHVYIKPRTPRLNGKVERSHRIDNEEFYRLLEGVVIDDTQLFNAKLQEWENFYNFDRPHGVLDGQTPYERLLQKTKTPT